MRSLRPALDTDAPTLAAFLRAEGLAHDEMAFDLFPTFVLEEEGVVMGFVTLAQAHDTPTLVHFVVGRDHRSMARARFLTRAVCALVREAGGARLIVHAGSETLRRAVAYYFRTAPYARTDDRAYYLVAC